jgi:hypothetical protein
VTQENPSHEQENPSQESAAQAAEDALMSKDLVPHLARLSARWPTYPLDASSHETASTAIPMLMMNGTLDASTPLGAAEQFAESFQGPMQTFVAFPGGSHGAAANTPLIDGEGTCGLLVMQSFLSDPTAPPDRACIEQLSPVEWADSGADAELAAWAFGTTSLWEND